MKTALAIALTLSAIAFGQDADRMKPKTPSDADDQPMKRLNSVTWDLETHKLAWTVQSGAEVDGKFVPASTQQYEISPDDAIMAFSDERRGFTDKEAQSLSRLLDVLSLYCAESVVWWDQGQGDPVGTDGKPQRRSRPPAPQGSPKKVEHPPAEPAPLVGNMALVKEAR
jgi:hypothetical protein